MTHRRSSLGLSGLLARAFQSSELTPLLALTGMLLGLFAVLTTPREEEPQINVTFANVFIPFPGASVATVEQMVTASAEQISSAIEGVEHVYSVTRPGMAMLTVRFEVGQPRTDAVVRLHNAFASNQNWLPANLGVGPVLIDPRGIDDVPVLALTLWSRQPELGAFDLNRVAQTLVPELKRVAGTRDIELIGAANRVVAIELDPERLAAADLTLGELQQALAAANVAGPALPVTRANHNILVQPGSWLADVEDVGAVIVGVRNGSPIHLRDVSRITLGPDTPSQYVRHGSGAAAGAEAVAGRHPALTITVSKQPGRNAVDVTDALLARVASLRGAVIPDDVEITVTRNYGETAQAKSETLIHKLMFATASVVLLVWLALGRREAVVVGAAVLVTLAITLFASWAWGFTLNRVSLFALIFSIGILVDDAIVVVENIHRHHAMGGRSLLQAIPAAVDEVGGPTILATFTVIAALLPMAFVSGLMGPYMRPIPINASTGMLISLAVAFVFTPWLYRRIFAGDDHASDTGNSGHDPALAATDTRMHRLFERIMTPFLRERAGNPARWLLLAGLIALIAGSFALVGAGAVIMKMLPFDNKSEFQVLVDLPEGTPLETTQALLDQLADELRSVPEVTHLQTYAGTAGPINFNGLVRQYALRSEPHQGDIQVNLLEKHLRQRKSHDIALDVRPRLARIAASWGAALSVVEVPPGPPVMAPVVAEIYARDAQTRAELTAKVRDAFAATADVVDIDSSLQAAQARELLQVNHSRAAALGVSQAQAVQTLQAALMGLDAGYLHSENARLPIPLRLELSEAGKADADGLNRLRLRAASGESVPLAAVIDRHAQSIDPLVHRKDGVAVNYVFGDVAGSTDSPLYGMAKIASALGDLRIDGQPVEQQLIGQPTDIIAPAIKWDGEWQITYETFRDMGIAYSVGLVLIYLLVVAQFRSYGLPLIIMAPIPLTLIGILPGHAVLAQPFTAPSMIGMIALAGIIVRNSILLVDFIQQQVKAGHNLQDATVSAAAVRARPIVLTAVAAMMGGFFIIDDPIFGGLAVALIFGLLVSTLLTLVVIPVVYYAYHWKDAYRARA